MRIFLSWSGKRSRSIAAALKSWLPDVIVNVETWMSDHDIAAGKRWGVELDKELETCNFGILCLTPENVTAPWLLYEAGSLAKLVASSRVVPYLLAKPNVTGPLSQFQGVDADKEGTLKLIRGINQILDKPLPDDRINRIFERAWPDLEREIKLTGKPSSSDHITAWMKGVSDQDSAQLQVFGERLSPKNKSSLLLRAEHDVIDLGTALNTCSDYLVTTVRPAYYREAVLALLERGVNYTCVILDPNSDICDLYGRIRHENLREKTEESIKRLEMFALENENKKGRFSVVAYNKMPYFAAIAIDRKDDGMFLVSSYLPNARDLNIGRADTPQFLLPKTASERMYLQMNSCVDYYLSGSRQLI